MRSLRRTLAASVAAALPILGVAAFAPGTASAQPAALSVQDQDFLIAAHQGNLAEMASGARATISPQVACAAVRQLGPVLVTDHGRLDASGLGVAMQNGVALPLTPSAAQTQQLMSTGMKTGADFDRAWLQMQQGFHTQTLAAINQELATGTSPAVKMVAQTAAPVVQNHLAMVNAALATC
ncbi:DUF4142 domain-containing protein [Skermania sp. ID1734]|uniref:DUF4142 domain-containing protein n=1 Tax=Skermania sp. ID1734 TaxID=2597516 RepID=UPI00117F7612|nr:DUF4142 domain-containing protein [Skermania sp. ID1734]TSD99464.1 DUF4142 domain-containing protein [Skermania sp. ID1734]